MFFRVTHDPFFTVGLYCIRLLSIMREPFTCGYFHIGEGRFKGGILGTAGINAEGYGSTAIAHMAHTHLLKCDAIAGTFNAIIVLTTAESIPH